MRFEWDRAKAEENRRKHRVSSDGTAAGGSHGASTQIPACLWFLARNKSGRGGSRTARTRDRWGQALFIGARKMGRMVDGTHRELTDEDIAGIAATYHA